MLQMIQDYRITSLCAPPTIFRFLIREDMTKYDLSSLQYCTIAGEALNPAVFDTFYKLTGIKLMEGFGQTETTLTVATFPWMEPKPGSMGVPNPQYDVDLLRPDGSRAEDGEQGQIVIHTTNGKPIGLFKEYYRDAERTREAWHDGLYYTGDVAWRDEDGYLWFVGRGRRDQEFRLPYRAVRGGKCLDDSPGGSGMCYHRCPRRDPRTGSKGHDRIGEGL